MAIGDVYRLRIVLRRSFVHPACINNLYFRQESALILDTPGEDIVQAFQSFVLPDYRATFTNFIAITQYQVAKAPLFLTEHLQDDPGVAGLLTGEPLPPRTSFCLSFRTAVNTRRGRSRIYLPPANETSNGNGAPTSTYTDLVDTLGQTLVAGIGDDITTGSYTLMMWSPADQVAREVTSHFVQGIWRSQRDRDGILSA